MAEQPNVDFLKQKYKLAPNRRTAKARKGLVRFVVGVFCLSAITGVVFSAQWSRERSSESPADPASSFSLFSSVKRLVTSQEKELVGEEDDRINMLLLGVGGAGHDGPELSDTIILASFRPSTKEVGMMSIPRDLAVPIPGYGYNKINHVNAYGEMEETGSGPAFAREVVGDVLDETIHYAVKVDFNGFEEVIDAIGGVDVYVERAFEDYQYPTEDDLVQTIRFTEGWAHMDGGTALKYSRSRHGTNGEGSDFARAKRQQNLILAVKDKVLSPAVLLSPGKLNKIIELFQENVETNLTFWEIVKLAKYAPDIDTDHIAHTVLDASQGSPLYASNINGAYVLLPKRDDWSDIRAMADAIFSGGTEDSAAGSTKKPVASARLEIQNGTPVSGLAFETSQLLSGSGFDVKKIGNADSRTYDKTIIYDLTQGKKSSELAVLKEFLEADVAMSASGWIFSDEVVPRELTVTTPGEDMLQAEEPIDFLIILGADATNLVLR